MEEISVGIDIGGTNTAIGVVNKNGDTLKEKSVNTAQYADVRKYVEVVHHAIQEALNELPEKVDLKGIGIGAPNGNYYRGTVEMAPNLKWKGIVPLAELFGEYYDVPVIVTNDANAAAIGEMMFGGAQGMNNFVVITLGTGLGSGIVVNGDVVYGHDGFAGELGHVIVVPGGRKCGCGRLGCLETYVSAPGITRSAFEILARTNQESEFSEVKFDDLNSKMISEAAQRGDLVAKEAFDFTGKILGHALADTVATLSPEAIFLFGGLSKAGDLIYKPTKQYMEEKMLAVFKDKVQILYSDLNERNGAILGAAALIWKEKKEENI